MIQSSVAAEPGGVDEEEFCDNSQSDEDYFKIISDTKSNKKLLQCH